MNRKSRALVAMAVFTWAAISMYLVWYTNYEIFGVIGFLGLAAMNIHYKNQTTGSAL